MKMMSQLTLTPSDIEDLIIKDLEDFNMPTTLYISPQPYSDLRKQYAANTLYSSPPSQLGGHEVFKIMSSAGEINVVVVNPMEYGPDLIMVTDDPKDLDRHVMYKLNKEMDEVFDEVLFN